MHHVSVIGLRPDDATMTVIKVDARHNLWPIFHTVPGMAGRRLQTDATACHSIGTTSKKCGKVRDLRVNTV